MVMQEGEKPIFFDPAKFLDEARQYHCDDHYIPPDPWEVTMKALIAATVDSIAELAEDIGFLAKFRAKTTDLDALGKIAILIDLNQAMMRDYQNELISQKAAYKLG